jgi:predicted DNA-binding WGR domain protein
LKLSPSVLLIKWSISEKDLRQLSEKDIKWSKLWSFNENQAFITSIYINLYKKKKKRGYKSKENKNIILKN